MFLFVFILVHSRPDLHVGITRMIDEACQVTFVGRIDREVNFVLVVEVQAEAVGVRIAFNRCLLVDQLARVLDDEASTFDWNCKQMKSA